jgi:tetratricopeptide (TPR) repeat protein
MSISLCPLDVRLGSRVIPAEKLNGNHNPLGKIEDSSSGFMHQGMELLKQGKKVAAKGKFLKMFNCKELKTEDFETVAKLLTDPKIGKTELQMDMFAKKFLKQARELGSNDPVIYQRLTELYFQKGSYEKAGLEVEKFKALNPNSEEANKLFLKVYNVYITPVTNNSISVALDLVKIPEYKDVANSILLKSINSYKYKRTTVGYLNHKTKISPAPSKYYSRIKIENRKNMATHFFNNIKNYMENKDGKSLISPYELLKNNDIKDFVVSLAIMESVGKNNMKKLCGFYLDNLGLDGEKVIKKATITRIDRPSYV